MNPIHYEMTRISPERQQALQLGLIRPFLFLVSMHPAGRYSIALALEIDFLNTVEFGNPHSEAMLILMKPKQGISSNADGYTKKMAGEKSNWYEVMYGLNETVLKLDRFGTNNKNQASVDRGNYWENILLEAISISNHSKIHPKYNELVDMLMKSRAFCQVFLRCPPAFQESEVLKRAIVETCLCAELAERNVTPFEDTGDQDSTNKMLDVFDQLDLDSKAGSSSNLQNFSDNLVRSLHNRLALGSGYYEKRKKAVTVGASVTVMAVTTFVITPLCFPAGLAIKIASMKYKKMHNEMAAHHRNNFSSIVLLLMHHVLLATQGIDVARYY